GVRVGRHVDPHAAAERERLVEAHPARGQPAGQPVLDREAIHQHARVVPGGTGDHVDAADDVVAGDDGREGGRVHVAEVIGETAEHFQLFVGDGDDRLDAQGVGGLVAAAAVVEVGVRAGGDVNAVAAAGLIDRELEAAKGGGRRPAPGRVRAE